MSAIIRPVLCRTALAFAVLSSLMLLLALACASESTPVGSTPPVPTATQVADGIVQTSGEAATPMPARTSKATSERTWEVQATVNDLKDNSEAITRVVGTGGGSQAASSWVVPGSRPPRIVKGMWAGPIAGIRVSSRLAALFLL